MDTRELATDELRAKRWNARIARKALDEFAASGMSLAAFARSRGVNFQRLFWWRKRLGLNSSTNVVTFMGRLGAKRPSSVVFSPGGQLGLLKKEANKRKSSLIPVEYGLSPDRASGRLSQPLAAA